MPKLFLQLDQNLLDKIHIKKTMDGKKSLGKLLIPVFEELTKEISLPDRESAGDYLPDTE